MRENVVRKPCVLSDVSRRVDATATREKNFEFLCRRRPPSPLSGRSTINASTSTNALTTLAHYQRMQSCSQATHHKFIIQSDRPTDRQTISAQTYRSMYPLSLSLFPTRSVGGTIAHRSGRYINTGPRGIHTTMEQYWHGAEK